MNVFDTLEAEGHDLTMLASLLAGVSTYYCEGCGCIIKIRDQEIVLFHGPNAQGDKCNRDAWLLAQSGKTGTLKSKLDKLQAEDYERLRRAAED